jgi:hypothetical protein
MPALINGKRYNRSKEPWTRGVTKIKKEEARKALVPLEDVLADKYPKEVKELQNMVPNPVVRLELIKKSMLDGTPLDDVLKKMKQLRELR